MVWRTYKEKIRHISDAIINAQGPIRILDAIKWDDELTSKILNSDFKNLPKIGPEYYERMSLGFDPEAKLRELEDIADLIKRDLTEDDPLYELLLTIVHEYQDVVHMLVNRGKKEFGDYSKKLYGSSKDCFRDDKNSISDLGRVLYEVLSKISDSVPGPVYPVNITADEVVRELNRRFSGYFEDAFVLAETSDSIVADATAGSDRVKIKEGALFSQRDIDIYEVHEAWVHIGTTQNGINQPVARWLAKGPPRTTAAQEGLAVLMEIFTFRTYPRRARRINNRVLAIEKVEDGANFLELVEFFRTEGYTEEECLQYTMRVFRGGTLEGGHPFTKDLSYCRGFVENYNFMRAAIRSGHPQLLPFMFAGKLNVEDVPLLYHLHQEGIVEYPGCLPPQFSDLNGIAVWMAFATFIGQIELESIQTHYDEIFRKYI